MADRQAAHRDLLIETLLTEIGPGEYANPENTLPKKTFERIAEWKRLYSNPEGSVDMVMLTPERLYINGMYWTYGQ